MKYITTDKHPELKGGRIIDAEHSAYFVVDKNRPFITDIEKGYIKEVQEPEFTKNETIDFARHYAFNNTSDFISDESLEKEFNHWKKYRK